MGVLQGLVTSICQFSLDNFFLGNAFYFPVFKSLYIAMTPLFIAFYPDLTSEFQLSI